MKRMAALEPGTPEFKPQLCFFLAVALTKILNLSGPPFSHCNANVEDNAGGVLRLDLI